MINHQLILEFEQSISASAASVWEALVNPELIKKYLFGTETITDWKSGSEIVFQGEWEGVTYRDHGTIREIIPQRILSYDYISSMSNLEDLTENRALITFEIQSAEDETTLLLKQAGFQNEDMMAHSEGNWKVILNQIAEIAEGLEA